MGRCSFNYPWMQENLAAAKNIDHPAVLSSEFIEEKGLPFREPLTYCMSFVKLLSERFSILRSRIVVGFNGGMSCASQMFLVRNDFFIEINSFYSRFRNAVSACLAHEMAHIFMTVNDIARSESGFYQERFADLLAVRLGLGLFLLNGRQSFVLEEFDAGIMSFHEKTLNPFLAADELGYAVAQYAAERGLDFCSLAASLNEDGKGCFLRGARLLQRYNKRNKRKNLKEKILC